jgi:hypothetical protein
MSMEFTDGFDHYQSAPNMALKWNVATGYVGSGTGRYGGQSALLASSCYVVLTSLATRYVGVAFMPSTGDSTVLTFTDGAGPTDQCWIQYTLSTAKLTVVLGDGTTVIGTLTGTYSPSTWYYIEVSLTIGSAGSITVHINGVVKLTLTGVNTQYSANATQSVVQLNNGGTGIYFDDLYILNTSGSVNNTFLGECKIITGLPSADSATNHAWTPKSGTVHFSEVNEADPDGDTTYNKTSTVSAIDTYLFPTVVTTNTIAAVQGVLTFRKDDAGSHTLALTLRSGTTNYFGTTVSVGGGYAMTRQIYETDPNTSAAWTVANLNAAEIGAKMIS